MGSLMNDAIARLKAGSVILGCRLPSQTEVRTALAFVFGALAARC